MRNASRPSHTKPRARASALTVRSMPPVSAGARQRHVSPRAEARADPRGRGLVPPGTRPRPSFSCQGPARALTRSPAQSANVEPLTKPLEGARDAFELTEAMIVNG